MKIIFLSIDPLENRRRLLNQIDTACRKFDDVEVFTIGSSGQPKVEKLEGYNAYRFRTIFKGGPLKFLSYNVHLLFFLLPRRFDIIQTRGLWSMPVLYVLRLFKTFKLVYDAHEYFAGLEVLQNRSFVRNFWLYFEKKTIRRGDLLITVSEPIAKLYRSQAYAENNWQVIRNLPPYQKPEDEIPEQFGINRKGVNIFFHGYYMPQRGLENLISSLTAIEKVHLHLFGQGSLKDTLIKLVKSLKLEKRIHFHPLIPYKQLISVISQATIGVSLLIPSSDNHKYALPNKFFEYIMAGVPVLASEIQTQSEYIKKYNIGLTTDPTSPETIAHTIELMLSDKDRIENWQKNCLAAAKELCWEKESQKLLNLYNSISNKPNAKI